MGNERGLQVMLCIISTSRKVTDICCTRYPANCHLLSMLNHTHLQLCRMRMWECSVGFVRVFQRHDCNIGMWHVSEAGFAADFQQTSVSVVDVRLGRRRSVLHIQFPVFKSDMQVLFSFSFHQTEYDNVTRELLDEKISTVPSAFFFFSPLLPPFLFRFLLPLFLFLPRR